MGNGKAADTKSIQYEILVLRDEIIPAYERKLKEIEERKEICETESGKKLLDVLISSYQKMIKTANDNLDGLITLHLETREEKKN